MKLDLYSLLHPNHLNSYNLAKTMEGIDNSSKKVFLKIRCFTILLYFEDINRLI